MTDQDVMNAQPRERAGKGAARAARRAGFVPAVIYGDKKDPRMINLDPRDVRKGLESGSFFATVYSLKIGSETERVIPRDVQMHPVKEMAQHVDFLRVSADTRVTVEVPVHFVNEEECDGLKRGGVLNVVRYNIEVVCGVDDIPSSFDVDLAGLDIGDSVHASTLALPSGVDLTITDRDFTIATIAAPTVVAEEEAEAAEGEAEEAAEGEVPAEAAEGEGEAEAKEEE